MIRRLAFAIALVLPFGSAKAQTYACLPATDSLTIVDRDYIVELVTSSDTATVADRNRFHLPSTTASKVTVVSSGAACTSAGAAYHTAVTAPGTLAFSRTLTVIKVGTTRYVVRDVNQRVGEFNTTVVFDKNWVKLVAWDS
jgi:hypothetical protein